MSRPVKGGLSRLRRACPVVSAPADNVRGMRILHTSDWHLGRSFHRVGMLAHQAGFVDHLLEVVESERKIAEETSRNEGKPEAALPKIVEGRLGGFFKENVLVEQAFAKDNKKSVGQVLTEAGGAVTGFVRFRVGA